ncbi:hypothetical protein CFT13S00388_02740 [Campylobacter fetus subsp. testudinum]|uniref:hypothetical protein n=1 Tax=Campylobacter fetus TaxID=196 RepID=UPI0008189771|nr:hypothetical protein [Campylobacter fetus]OCR88100.1 hypothetical protein CFT13S00388_02740 [Campylobacter fetus subsp. testudinum]
MKVEDILKDREETHGDFSDVARYSFDLSDIFRFSPNYAAGNLSKVQMVGIEMILHKLSRIMCGNPNEIDHYKDIQGYAELIIKDIKDNKNLFS